MIDQANHPDRLEDKAHELPGPSAAPMVSPSSATAAADAPEPLLWTAEDVARELRVSLRTIRRLDAEGKLPRPIQIGRAVRWRRLEVLAWVDDGCPARAHWKWKPEKLVGRRSGG